MNFYLTLYSTGTIRVLPADAKVCKDILGGIETSVQRLYSVAERELGKETFEFLDEPERDYVLASLRLCEEKIHLAEYSVLVMPLAKVFEGFAKKLLIGLKVGDKNKIDDPNFFREAFNCQPYKKLLSDAEDKKFLERLQKNLPFSRHGLVHSPPHPDFVMENPELAIAKKGEILTIIRETFGHFRGRI